MKRHPDAADELALQKPVHSRGAKGSRERERFLRSTRPMLWLGRWSSWSLMGLFLLVGCDGVIHEPGADRPPDIDPNRPPPSLDPEIELPPEDLLNDGLEARVWRLSPLHYRAEIERVFGDQAPTTSVPAGSGEKGFTDIAAGSRIDQGNMSAFAESARSIATWAAGQGASFSGCGGEHGTDACVDTFLDWFLEAAFRRPPTNEERTETATLFRALISEYDFDYALTGVIRAVLLSPGFLYRTELGESDEAGTAEMSDYEIASLLAFAITDRGPDDELMAAAQRGELKSPEVREAHARRLMDESKGIWQRFFWEWLHMAAISTQGPEVGLSETLVDQIREEYETFVGTIVVDDRGSLGDLFASTHTWVRPELAEHYGLDHPGSGLEQVELDPTQRSGLLTLGAWLVSHGREARDHVVKRGMGLFVEAMCNDISPPEDLDVLAENEALVGPDATVRETAAARGAHMTCGACHRVSDPVGLAFENFAGDGSWRTEYNDGNPVESWADIDGIGDVTNPAELATGITQSGRFQQCLVRRFAHYLVGFDLGSPSAYRWTNQAYHHFVDNDLSFEELLVALVRDPAFIERSK